MTDQDNDFVSARADFWSSALQFLRRWRVPILAFGGALALGLIVGLVWVRAHPLSQAPASTDVATISDPVHKPLPAPMAGGSTNLPTPPPQIEASGSDFPAGASTEHDSAPAPTPPNASADEVASSSPGSPEQPIDAVSAGDDRGPRVVERVQPAYPPDALSARVEGEVRLQIGVGAKGNVDEVRIVANSGSDSLDRAALNAARNWRYQPAMHDGQPIAGTIEVSVDFRIPDQL